MPTKSAYNVQVQEFYDSVTFERMARMSSLVYRDDFVGAGSAAIPAAGSAENGVDWVKKIVGAAPPLVANVANGAGGQVACTLTATSEKQDAALYWGDNLGLDATKGLIYEARCQLSVVPSAAGVQCVWGVQSVWIDGPNNAGCFLRFGATANGNIIVQAYDGVTTTSFATAVTVLNTEWHTYRIDATNVADVRFYIDGVQVTTTGQVNFVAIGALAVLQPYHAAYKPSGTGIGTLTTDFVKAWANRV